MGGPYAARGITYMASMDEDAACDEARPVSAAHDPRVAPHPDAHPAQADKPAGSGHSTGDMQHAHDAAHHESGYAAAVRGDHAAAFAAGGGSDRLYDPAPIASDGNRVGGTVRERICIIGCVQHWRADQAPCVCCTRGACVWPSSSLSPGAGAVGRLVVPSLA